MAASSKKSASQIEIPISDFNRARCIGNVNAKAAKKGLVALSIAPSRLQ
jgi:hypothetical protein